MPVSGSTGYRSGFLGLPPRVNLHKIDNAMGTYPTIARTGDSDYTGKFPSLFNDTTTLIFSGTGGLNTDQDVVYPTLLPRTYVFATSSVNNTLGFSLGVATPNITSSLTSPGGRVLVSGISDRMFRFSTNNESSQSFKPFNDSRIYLTTGSFYTTGTDPNILPGFSSKLGNKTQITIDLNPREATTIAWSTGSEPNAVGYPGGVNSGVGYFNWDRKRWEVIGDLTTGSNVDFMNEQPYVRTGSYWAFPNGMGGRGFSGTRLGELASASGFPVNFSGFPLASKFDATGSQLLKMEDYISHPFLLEKIVFQWTGSINSYALRTSPGNYYPQTSAFFMMNQFQTEVSRSVRTGKQMYLENEGTDRYILTHNGPFHVSREKDLVAFGTITTSVSRLGNQLEKYEKRDLVLLNPSDLGVTSSFMLETTVDVAGIYPTALFVNADRNRGYDSTKLDMLYIGNPDGGRNLFAESSGRSFIASTVGATPSGSAFIHAVADNQQYMQPYINLRRVSPYVLLPTDKLVFGFAHQPTPYLQETIMGAINTERGISGSCVMAPGPSKVTMFGSILRNNLPVRPQANQPLTSDAIHEALYDDAFVTDQFQVDPFYTYSGSYIDEIYAGRFLDNTRHVAGSCTAGTQGTTGSLLRGVKLKDTTERYYDSLMPSLAKYFARSEMSGTIFERAMPGVTTGNRPARGYKDLRLRSFYFSGAMECSAPGSITRWKGYRALPFPYEGNPSRVLKDDVGLIVSASYLDEAYETILDYTSLKEALFQVGIQQQEFPVYVSNTRRPAGTVGHQIISDDKFSGARALRYGIASVRPLHTTMVYRYDHYGQFRDLLEQRIVTRFYDVSDSDTRILDSPLQILFVNAQNQLIEAASTLSQNLSPFATSSKPYFDNMQVDRKDNPYTNNEIVVGNIEGDIAATQVSKYSISKF